MVERVLLKNKLTIERYDLDLEPDLDRFVFNGLVKIGVIVHEDCLSVQLHSKDLQWINTEFVSESGKKLKPIQLNFELEHYTMEMIFAEALPVGKGSLNITFVGEHNNQMAGFYRSGYTAINGEKRTMVSTQFESIDARRAFPCVDEPAVKAVFGVTMTVASHLTALSNMPETEVCHLSDGRKRVSFRDSPIMSTYLLAFCVGEFDFVQATTDHGVQIRVYTPPGKASHGRFSLECARRSLDLYDSFFGVPYPLPKLDMIAIPEFAMGAMENWGLVTYREIALLIDPAKASPQQMQRVCIVVTHELAHQWFGNLVTMAWWDDLWLNEGFASFMENYAADVLFPTWGIWDQFVTDTLRAALDLDALESSHPIQVPIGHAEEVEEVFDSISYCKGACVVRMLHEVLGATDFRKGLQLYMRRHSYKNTETIDLWQALEEASGKPVKQLMRTWTEQTGFPVVTVVSETWGPKGVLLSLRQSLFLASGKVPDHKPLWTVPIVATASAGGPASVSLHSREDLLVFVPLPNATAADWVKLNAGHVVPARIAYTPGLLARLANGVRTRTLPAQDRAGLLLDTLALCKAQRLGVPELLQLLAAYRGDFDSTVLDAVASALGELDTLLRGQGALYAAFEVFAATLAQPAAAHYGWEAQDADGHLGRLARATAISMGAVYGDNAELLAAARLRFARVVADPASPTAVASELRGTMLQIVARRGGAAEREQLLGLYRSGQSDAERRQAMLALGRFADPALRAATLEWAIGGEVKLQDFFFPMMAVSGASAAGQDACWDFFVANFDKIRALIAKASPSLMDAVIGAACGSFVTDERADTVHAFFATKDLPLNQRTIEQTLETIRANAVFLRHILASDAAAPAFWASL